MVVGNGGARGARKLAEEMGNPDHKHHWDEEAEGGRGGKELGNILN